MIELRWLMKSDKDIEGLVHKRRVLQMRQPELVEMYSADKDRYYNDVGWTVWQDIPVVDE